ncbi:MAG TPA: hypothetical protein VG165_00220 [Solirubrobacteraceae bacterium]|jgi:hypothetical protein|nr:hypothetical protein [Solirubrobacteraceae bacterium]
MTGWWAGLPAAEATVECGGATHRIRWEDGRLGAPDHDDAEGERALAALGGEPCACVDLLDAWARHEHDVRVLVIASRGPIDLLIADDRTPQPTRSGLGRIGAARSVGGRGARLPRPKPGAGAIGWAASVSRGWVGPMSITSQAVPVARVSGGPIRPAFGGSAPQTTPDAELLGLLNLGGGLAERLQAGVIAAWAQRLAAADERCAAVRPQLAAALHGRASAALRGWLGQADLSLELEMVDAGQAPTVGWAGRDRVRAALPFAWLETVWARGLATVMGRLCLTATSPDGHAWELSTVGPELGRPEPINLALPRPGRGGR